MVPKPNLKGETEMISKTLTAGAAVLALCLLAAAASKPGNSKPIGPKPDDPKPNFSGAWVMDRCNRP
jgi:hypothetical protein